MRKKFSILITIIFFSLLFSVFLIAQETLEQEVVEQETGQTEENDLTHQGPITEADIKIILKVMPEIDKLENPDLAVKKLNKYNMTKARFIYLASKMPHTLMAAIEEPGWEETLKNVPPFMVPNEAEIKVVKKYKNQLTKLFSKKLKQGKHDKK